MYIFKVYKSDMPNPKNIKIVDLNINPTRPANLTKQQSQFTTHYTLIATSWKNQNPLSL